MSLLVQYIVVGLILLGALIYLVAYFRRKRTLHKACKHCPIGRSPIDL